MRIGLIDVDGHRWPNLCLMKLSAYHKGRGDTVEWHRESQCYDLVYMSRVFTDSYSKDFTGILKAFDESTITLEMDLGQEKEEITFNRKDIAAVRLTLDF